MSALIWGNWGENEEVPAFGIDRYGNVGSRRQLENISGPANLATDPEGASDRAVCPNSGQLQRFARARGLPGQRHFETWRHDPGACLLINGVVALLDGNGIQNLSNQSNVVYISLDRPLTPTLSNAAAAVNAQFAWQSNYTGAGIGVAVIDSGVSNHGSVSRDSSVVASCLSAVLCARKLQHQ